ncbi:MAG: ABC transporter substrate-binding protein [Deltaproteobacteria bacterium]|nr:ABC transporter substrate-binding protein [Deltaproteobacteria bacterium]
MRVSLPILKRVVPLAALACGLTGCSLGNVTVDRCTSNEACAVAFGPGSTCDDGFCTASTPCETTAECRSTFGYGAVCESGRCAAAPAEPRCNLSEPPQLAASLPTTFGQRILIGALLKDTTSQNARASALRLAVSEINGAGGIDGFPLGLLVCRNDAGEGTSDNDETGRLTDYLAGSLGVPLILGPASSSNVAAAVARLKVGERPTALVSPSATAAGITDDPVVFAGRGPTLFWRTCPRDPLQAAVLVSEVEKVGPTGVVVVYQNDPYGSGIESDFRTGWKSVAPMVALDSLPFRVDTNLDGDLAKAAADAKAKSPSALLLVSADPAHTLKFFNELVKVGFAPPKLFLTDGSRSKVLLDPALSEPVKDLMRSAIGTSPAAFDPGAADAFAKFGQQMQSLYEVTVTSFAFVSHSYDAAYVGAYGLLSAVAKSGRKLTAFDGFDVAEGFTRLSKGDLVAVGQGDFLKASKALTGSNTVNIAGISGPLNFDATRGEAPGPIEVWAANATFDDFKQLSVVSP